MSNINSDAINNDQEVDLPEDLNTAVEVDAAPVETTESTEKPASEEKGARAAAARALASLDTDKPAETNKPATTAPALKTGQELDPISGRVLDPIRPPASMSPDLREQWGTVPRRMQQYWNDREKQISTELGRTTEARKFYDEFRGIAAPYEPMFRQYGKTASGHVKELFETSHALTTGTAQQRAAIIVSMMQQFKPDPQTMQALISGQQAHIQPFTAPQVQMSEDELADRALQKRESAKYDQDAATSITAFEADPTNEFYSDVKQTMGQLIAANIVPEADMATMLRQAYDLAVANNPAIQEALKLRGTAVQRSPAAASTAPTAALHVTAAVQAPARATPSAKPSIGAGVSRNATPKKFKNARDAARAALDSSGWLD